MPCLIALVALAAPRIVLLVLYFLTNWFNGLFTNLLWPILGFIFLPTTLLWYTAVMHWYGGVWGTVPVVGMVLAVLFDLSPHWRRR